MVRTLLRASTAMVLAVTIGMAAAPAALADTGAALSSGVVQSANIAIKNAMTAQTHKADRPALPGGTLAQVPPVRQQPVSQQQLGLPTGFTYTFDLSIAKPFGDIGSKTGWLPGGMDVVAGYGFDPTTRIVANYYELQHYPAGFNSGVKPFYIQGLPNGAPVDLAQLHPQIDVATKDRFVLLNLEKLFLIKLNGGKVIPLVVTPTYVARWSKIASSPSNNDIVAFEHNGYPVYGVHTRTAQVESIAFTLPFLKTPKMFGTFTVAPSWLVHTAGLNQDNHVQLYQILYLEYNPTPTTKFFFEPQSSRDYLPADPYAQHLMAYFLGVSQRIGNAGFVQLVLNSGGPTNYSPYGVSALYCQQAGNCANTTVPAVGGLKATQLQIQFGIGSPSVIQF